VTLRELREAGALSPLDEHFGRAVARLAGDARPEIELAAAAVSRDVSNGHVCLDLRRLAGRPVLADESGAPVAGLSWPEAGAWLAALRDSPLVGGADDVAPLVLDAAGRLYLRRYWEYERRLAEALRARAAALDESFDPALLREVLRRLFPSPTSAEPDWQRLAALTAVRRKLCVISGGPGTGKTYTVVKILALLAELCQRAGRRPPRVTLAAPTGKAAARLVESIRSAKATLDCSERVVQAIPEEAATIHRCLGAYRDSATRFRHDADDPLATDIVLVDEASMVDLALMARLIDAVPGHARLVLLGDKDQLASVEAGAVLGDICNTGAPRRYSRSFVESAAEISGERLPLDPEAPDETGIWDCIVELTRSYRYEKASGIGSLAAAINRGDAQAALCILESDGASGVSRREPAPAGALGDELRGAALRGFAAAVGGGGEEERLRSLERFRVLCAHRRGAHGVETTNDEIERALVEAGLLRIDSPTYVGRPVMVTRNDYQVGLFNGDVGLIVADERRERGRVAVFLSSQGLPRRLSPSRLPPHETVFAMSVHKSQGSEFDEVAVLLPDRVSPVVSRELLYTAVTRARGRVTVYATRDIVAQAVARPIERASGLRDALWGEGGSGG
jgi:exodeoxyribonuclease V alpha subunit